MSARPSPPALAAALIAAAGLAGAQPAPSAAPPSSAAAPSPSAAPSAPAATDTETAARKAQARELFTRGLSLLEAGQIERALDNFLRSRALLPNKSNTLNAALCLDRLGRYDEALELYEDLIASFSRALDDDDRRGAAAAMQTLSARVGSLTLSATVSGVAVVDGRERGRLPLSSSIKLLPGKHLVRVIKDGHRTFEREIDVEVGKNVHVDAQLAPLEAAGGLRVEDAALPGADVLVDGVVVGQSPWEGTLAPGPHVVASRSMGRGSMPTLAQVLQGQTALLRLKSAPLGPEVRLSSSPDSAELRLGDVPLGRGRWRGPLPRGAHAITASEEGYVQKTAQVVVPESGDALDVRIDLDVDAAHPRWPKKPSGHALVGALTGLTLGPTMASTAEAACTAGACRDDGLVTGFVAGLRVGYELSFRLSIEAAGGYASLRTSVARDAPGPTLPSTGGARVTYEMSDIVRLRGFWVGAGPGYRLPLGPSVDLRARLLVGALIAKSSDTLTGEAVSGGERTRAAVENAGQSTTSTPVLVIPEIGASTRLSGVDLGVSIGALVVVGQGPTLPSGTTRVSAPCPATNLASPGCSADSAAFVGERGHGTFVVALPSLWLSKAF